MYRKVVVCLDGSELSEHALKHGQTIVAKDPGASLILLRVMEPALPAAYYMAGAGEYWPDIVEKVDHSVVEYLTETAAALRQSGVTNIQTVMLKGKPDEEILNYLAETDIDLVIMTTHGRSGVSRWLMGSVAERVMRHSAVPVLVVPPPGSRTGKEKDPPTAEQ